MAIFDIFFFVVSVIFLGICYVKKKYRYWEERGVPFIKPSFPKGNLVTVGRTEQFSYMMRRFYFELKDQGSPIGGIYFSVKPVALALDLDFIKTILIKDFQHFHDRGFYNDRNDPLSDHMLVMEGERWKNLRTKLSPAFTTGKLKLMFPIIKDISAKLVACVEREIVKDGDIDLDTYMSRFSIDVIGSCAFGLECNSLNDPDTEFYRMGRKAFYETGHQAFKRWFATTFKSLATFLRFRVTRKDVAEFYTGIVKKTVSYRESENVERNDFMNLLIQLKNKGKLDDDPGKSVGKITLNEVIANAFLFLVAGFETSSMTMKCCLLELAHEIKIQGRLREEISSVLRRYGNKITYEALSEMKYLDQVIYETLRKHPVAGTLARCLETDYKVPKTDVVLEKGTHVFIPIMGIHRNPDFFPDPDKFDPDRFTPEAIKSRHPCAYLAFGDGPRNCIGMRFGMMQTKIAISGLLMNYKFSPCDKTNFPVKYDPPSRLLTLLGGCWLKVEKL
ncbi:probable cytochrome P450 6a14 [Phlebotomus argentipes]|uniref:probable cytochrome P450 6a14 n=1 Tax=Phlebotomus argentipes TaxID=94469 RepID=UPI002893653F|nr:probable cytochrome P450 6a14 [Phlebotomus argentipes]